MTDIPPKLVRRQLFDLDQRPRFGLSGAPRSLPVLEAFQQFLEGERQKARRRMIVLASAFSLLILALITGGIVAGLLLADRTEAETQRVRRDLRSYRDETLRSQNEMATHMAHLTDDANEFRRKLETSVRVPMLSRSNEMETLRGRVRALARENAQLDKELAAVRLQWPVVNTEIDTVRREVALLRSRMTKPAVATVVADLEPKRVVYSTLVVPIIPRGDNDRVIALRLPIPE